MDNKNPGCLAIIATAVGLLVFIVVMRGDFTSPEAWKARGDYEIAVAAADAVRAQTRLLDVLMRWQSVMISLLIALVVTVLISIIVIAGTLAYNKYYFSKQNQQKSTRLPTDRDVLLEAPIRENTPTGN